jgi:hypothetical protein
MNKTQEIYNIMSRKQFELSDKQSELMQAQDNYKDHLVSETIAAILQIQEESGKLTERDLEIILRNLSTDIKHIYSR